MGCFCTEKRAGYLVGGFKYGTGSPKVSLNAGGGEGGSADTAPGSDGKCGAARHLVFLLNELMLEKIC